MNPDTLYVSPARRAVPGGGGAGATTLYVSAPTPSRLTAANADFLYRLENANDSGPGALHLVAQPAGNPPTFTAGKVNNAGTFVAANEQYFRHEWGHDRHRITGDCTFLLWVKMTDKVNTMAAASVEAYQGDSEWELGYDSIADRYYFIHRDPTFVEVDATVKANTFGAPAAGAFHMIAVVCDLTNSLLKISVNNGAFDQVADSVTAFGTGMFSIGQVDGLTPQLPWNGQVDEFAKFPFIATAGELAEFWAGGAGYSIPA